MKIADSFPQTSQPDRTVRDQRQARWRGWLLLGGFALALLLAIVDGAWRTPADPVEPLVLHEGARLCNLDSAATLRVATFNIHAGVGRDGVRDLARTARCLNDLDVAALQEVRNPLWSGEGPQVRMVADQLGMGWLFVPAERRWWHNHYGNALLTRAALVDCVRIPLPSPNRQRFRSALLANFRFQGETVHLLAVHIDKDLEKRTHDEQLRTAFDLFLSLREPAVLLGDLNDVASHPELVRLLQSPGVQNALADASRAGDHSRAIDWIITRGFQTVRSQWRDGVASDHPAAWAELQLIPKIAVKDRDAPARGDRNGRRLARPSAPFARRG